MLLNLGIVGITYIATKYYKKYRAKLESSPAVNTDEELTVEVEPQRAKTHPEPAAIQKSTQIEDTVNNNSIEKEQATHYLKMSGVAIGLALLAPLSAPIALLSLGAFTYISMPVIRQFEKSLFEEKKVDGYVLYFVADALTLALGYYVTTAFAVGLFHTSRYITTKAKDYSQNQLIQAFNEHQQPSTVWIIKERTEIEIPLESVANGDLVVVNMGEIIPVDGFIVQGRASVDQHHLTGESQPVEKIEGEQVFASTVLTTGRIVVKVEKSGQETTIAKIQQILTDTSEFKTNKQLKGEQWADTAILPVLGVAGAVLPILGPEAAVVVLNSHISSVIRIIAPLSTLNCLTLAYQKGILIKDGRALEAMAEIDTFLFDKTGTLTYDQLKVGEIITCSSFQEKEILTYAATAERRLNHPIANAILQKASEYNIELPDIDESLYKIGFGITIRHDNEIVKVGSARFMQMEGVSLPDMIFTRDSSHQKFGESLVFVAINDHFGGAIEIQTTARLEAIKMIKGLRDRGIKNIAVVSGDHQSPTENLAKSLEIDDYFYEVLPQDKARIVEQMQQQGRKVCFVGDGVNDTIAMRKADLSISLRGASTIATDVAQVVLLNQNLLDICHLFDISKELNGNLQNSLVINALPGAIIFAGAFLQMSIPTAIAISGASLMAGVGNAMLPLRKMSD